MLRLCGAGLSTGLAWPWLGACNKAEDPGPAIRYEGTVAIIGAGAAGLYAGDILYSQGLDVVIFEASGRPGGRVQTFNPGSEPSSSLFFDPENLLNYDFPLELGAEKIYGAGSAWGQLANKLDVPVIEVRSSAPQDRYLLDKSLQSDSTLTNDTAYQSAKNFFNALIQFAGRPDLTVAEAIQNAGIDAHVHAILNSWIGNRYGTSNDRLGIAALAEALTLKTHGGIPWMLKGNAMESVLFSGFNKVMGNVQLNTAIQSIDYSGERIALIDQNGKTILADKVIVTVPVSILSSGDILFTPELPAEKVSAMQSIGMDASVRMALGFKKNIWGNDVAFLLGGQVAPEYFNCGAGRTHLLDNKFLNVTIHGQAAEALSAMGANMVDAVIAELDETLDGQASLQALRGKDESILFVAKDWSKDPWIKGGISYLKPGGSNEDRIALAAPVGDRLFFAGEATDTKGDAGTVSGALQSAARAAQEIIDSILVS